MAAYLGECGHELYGKSDLRFMEGVYRAIRDELGYSPKLSRTQFFSTGFAEHKMMMVTDMIRLIIAKNKELKQAAKSRFNRVPTNRHAVEDSEESLKRSFTPDRLAKDLAVPDIRKNLSDVDVNATASPASVSILSTLLKTEKSNSDFESSFLMVSDELVIPHPSYFALLIQVFDQLNEPGTRGLQTASALDLHNDNMDAVFRGHQLKSCGLQDEYVSPNKWMTTITYPTKSTVSEDLTIETFYGVDEDKDEQLQPQRYQDHSRQSLEYDDKFDARLKSVEARLTNLETTTIESLALMSARLAALESRVAVQAIKQNSSTHA